MFTPGETYSQAAEQLKRQADKKKERDNPLSQAMVR
jgi:hypothetical protein